MKVQILWGAAVIVLAALTLLLFSQLLGVHNLDLMLNYINDSIGHVTTARHVADDHHAETSLIYLLMLPRHATHLYMPGYYLLLAFSYLLLGVSTFAALLPNFIAYIATSVLIYLVASHRYGIKTGVLAAVIFILIPCQLGLTFMAMTELTLTFVIFLSFTIFYFAKIKYKYFLAPVLITVCYLFRQTAIFMLIPFVLQIVYEDHALPIKKYGKLAVTCLVTVILTTLSNKWMMSQGMYGVDFKLLLSGGIKYGSAFQITPTSSLPILLYENFMRNLHDLLTYSNPLLTLDGMNGYYRSSLYLFLIFEIVCIVQAIKTFRQDFFPLATILMSLALFLVCMVIDVGYPSVVMRIVLYSMPFLAISASVALLNRKNASACLLGVMILLLVHSGLATQKTLNEYRQVHDKRLQFFASLHLDAREILVSPVDISMEWVLDHYPLKWTFVPTDEATLKLLQQKYAVNVIVLSQYDLQSLPHEVLVRNGMGLSDKVNFAGTNYYVYKSN